MTELTIKEKEEQQNRTHESIQESGLQRSQTLCKTDLPGNWFKGVERILKEMVLETHQQIISLWKEWKNGVEKTKMATLTVLFTSLNHKERAYRS